MLLLLVVQAVATADAGQQLRDEQVKHGGQRQPSLSSLLHAVERGASEVLPYVPQAVANPVDHTKVKKKRHHKKKDPYAGLSPEERMYKKLHSFPQTELLKKKLKGLKLYTKEVQDYDHQLAQYDRDEDKELREAELRRWKARKAEIAAEAAEEHAEGWQEAVDDSRDAEEAEQAGKAYVDMEDAKLRKHFDRGPGVPVVAPVTKNPGSLLEVAKHLERSVEREHPELTPEALEEPFDHARSHFEQLQHAFERKLAKVDNENLRDHDEQELDPAMRLRAEELRRDAAKKKREQEAVQARKAEEGRQFEDARQNELSEREDETPLYKVTTASGMHAINPKDVSRFLHSSLTEEEEPEDDAEDDSSFLELGRPHHAKRHHAKAPLNHAIRHHAKHQKKHHWTVQGGHPHSLVEKRPHDLAHAGAHVLHTPVHEDEEEKAYNAETPSEIEEADAYAAFQKKMANIKASEAHDNALETKWLKDVEKEIPGHPHIESEDDD